MLLNVGIDTQALDQGRKTISINRKYITVTRSVPSVVVREQPAATANVASATAAMAVICHLHLSPVCRMICLSLTSCVCTRLVLPRFYIYLYMYIVALTPVDTAPSAVLFRTTVAAGVHIGLLFHYRKMFSTRQLLVIFPSSARVLPIVPHYPHPRARHPKTPRTRSFCFSGITRRQQCIHLVSRHGTVDSSDTRCPETFRRALRIEFFDYTQYSFVVHT